jgi:rare lipoprotein A
MIRYRDTLSKQKFKLDDLTGSVKKTILIVISGILFSNTSLIAQDTKQEKEKGKKEKTRILYGTASFYSNKFQGRKTANGEIFDQKKMTAACNVLPLGTWVRVTNLRNKKSVIVKINDRLHTKMKRIVDLSRVAADKLNYIRSGLTRVKVEVLGKKKPD